MKIVSIVPSRSGSIRLVNKNKKKINGKSLVDRALEFSKKIKFVDNTILTTDDKFFISKFRKDKNIYVIKRPKDLASSKAKMVNVILHALKFYKKNFGKVDAFILLQPTSPYRSISKINLAFKFFKLNKLKKTVVSVSKTFKDNNKNFFIKKNCLILTKRSKIKKEKKTYQMNGNFYLSSVNLYTKSKSFYGKHMTYPIELKSKKLSVDIDTKIDFDKAKEFSKHFEE